MSLAYLESTSQYTTSDFTVTNFRLDSPPDSMCAAILLQLWLAPHFFSAQTQSIVDDGFVPEADADAMLWSDSAGWRVREGECERQNCCKTHKAIPSFPLSVSLRYLGCKFAIAPLQKVGWEQLLPCPPLDQALSSISYLVHEMALLVLNWWNRGCH